MKTDGFRSLFQTLAKTIGAARFIERDLEPKIRGMTHAYREELERVAYEAEHQLTRQLHEGKTKNDQRRVRER